MWNLCRRFLAALGPDLTALILFTLLWVGTMMAHGVKMVFVASSTILPSAIAIGLLTITFFNHAREILARSGTARTTFLDRAKRTLRDWLPLIYLVAVYESLREYTGIIRPDNIDTLLYQWDLRLFGVEPVLWIQKFIHPIWTDYFAFMYMLYFFLPMLVAGLVFAKGERGPFRELALSCVLCMYVGYLLYLVFPAGPPRFYGLPFEPPRLTGFFGFYDFTQREMDTGARVLHHSSFPSLHAALSLLAVFHAIRYGRIWKRGWLIFINSWIAVSIWIATIYLRHHWLVDLFAGWSLAAIAFFSAIWLSRIWPRPEGSA